MINICRYEKCRQKPVMPSHHPLRHDGTVIRNSDFFEGLETFSRRREWVKAVLRCLRRKEAISPPDQPIHSLQTLEYLDMVGFKIMRVIQFEETSDEWSRHQASFVLYGTKKIVNLSEKLYPQNQNGGALSGNHIIQETACGFPRSYWHSVTLT